MAVDCVTFADEDSDEVPPSRVLTIHGQPGYDGFPQDRLTFEVSDYDETNTSATRTTIATFTIPADELRAAVALVLGETLDPPPA